MMAASRRRRMLLVCKMGLEFLFQLIVALVGLTTFADADINITNVNICAQQIGYELFEKAKYITYLEEIQKSFEAPGTHVKTKYGIDLVRLMSDDIEKMMAWKIQAIQRITDTAEEAMMGFQFEDELNFPYNNAKLINKEGEIQLPMTKDKHFYNIPVNTKNSSVHVPTNVYDKAADVVNAIRWSENLNPIFQSNYHLDPSLSWQYFGSSTGFLRQYPAMEWTSDTVDTYDCRMRPWYIEAATHPKDMVILLDVSGSMTGRRREIAKHVVLNILDTLNDDDYFSIFKFNDTIEDLVPCFKDSLVPANMENIREFKKALAAIHTENVANFSLALVTAFNALKTNNERKEGSLCNQAIMVITDGAPHMFDEIFKEYNWPNRSVRIFTYLIGQEMSDVKEVEWMACSNRGFYSHVSTIAEARDQVQHYVPVMARPLVLHQVHNVIWTSVYADIADPKLSDWLWEQREKKSQRELLQFTPDNDRSGDAFLSDQSYLDESLIVKDTEERRSEMENRLAEETPFYRLMTTVAYPVFDRSNKTKRMAHILGVAGTDVPIEEITKLATPYKLGVNGYSFAITNNGYILFHPDLRPVYNGILKPDYNSVDLAEAELRDNDLPPREFDNLLLSLRRKMIDRELNHTSMTVKVHLDDMKRIAIRHQSYYFSPLTETPFSFAIAMPEGYGMHEVVGKFKLDNFRSNNITLEYRRKVLSLFEGNKWAIHPDWIYCRNLYSNPERPVRTREENLSHFMKLIPYRNLSWKTHKRVKPLPKGEDYCDHELIESLIFDANATKNHEKQLGNLEKRTSAARTLGVTVSFVATRTGLTRWEEFDAEGRNFGHDNNRAIDELWYKRAVDYYLVDNKSLVISVPFDAYTRNYSLGQDSMVTATYAIFVDGKAPAAVVGLQFKLSQLSKWLHDITSMNCSSDDLDCFILDNNGFIIFDDKSNLVGKFYGEVDDNIMENLIQDGIFKRIHMVDYQAVCFDELPTADGADILLTPFIHLKLAFTWLWYKVIAFYLQYSFASLWNGDYFIAATSNYDFGEDYIADAPPMKILNKTRPRPCDKEFYLYELNRKLFAHTAPRSSSLPCDKKSCNKSYAMQLVPYTNLVLLIIEDPCECNATSKVRVTLSHSEINYNETQMCQWLKSNIYRRRPRQCVNYHHLELNIRECGRGSRTHLPSVILVVLALVISILVRHLRDG